MDCKAADTLDLPPRETTSEFAITVLTKGVGQLEWTPTNEFDIYPNETVMFVILLPVCSRHCGDNIMVVS